MAGGGFNGWPTVWVGQPSEPPPPLPSIVRFEPSTYTVVKGKPVTLRWRTELTDRLELEGASVPVNGQKIAIPDKTKLFTLVATNKLVSESVSDAIEITVNPTAQPVEIAEFTVSPVEIVEGGSAELRWRVNNASTIKLGEDSVRPSGSRQISPLTTAEYTLKVAGHQGPVEKTVTVTVKKLEAKGSGDNVLADAGGFLCTVGAADDPSLHSSKLLLLAMLVVGIGRLRARRRPKL